MQSNIIGKPNNVIVYTREESNSEIRPNLGITLNEKLDLLVIPESALQAIRYL